MKKLFTILVVAMCSTLAMAQTNQYFWAGGHFIMGNPINQIDSITFGQLDDTDSIMLYLPHTIKVVHDTVVKYVTIHDTVWANEHQYVDLGLSVKWATCNVGASKPEEFGGYFAWGETSTKCEYNWNTYKYCNGSANTLTKYCTNSTYGIVDNKVTLEKGDDAASVNWGGNWRTPTYAECNELINSCTIIWTNNYNGTGVAGRIFTSKVVGYTDKSIFIPAAGACANDDIYHGIYDVGELADYWTSSLDQGKMDCASYLCFRFNFVCIYGHSRSYGRPVRPVYK